MTVHCIKFQSGCLLQKLTKTIMARLFDEHEEWPAYDAISKQLMAGDFASFEESCVIAEHFTQDAESSPSYDPTAANNQRSQPPHSRQVKQELMNDNDDDAKIPDDAVPIKTSTVFDVSFSDDEVLHKPPQNKHIAEFNPNLNNNAWNTDRETLQYRPWVYAPVGTKLYAPNSSLFLPAHENWTRSKWLYAAGVSSLPLVSSSQDAVDLMLIEDVYQLCLRETVYVEGVDNTSWRFIAHRARIRYENDPLPPKNQAMKTWWHELPKQGAVGFIQVRDYVFLLIRKDTANEHQIVANPFVTQLFYPHHRKSNKDGLGKWTSYGAVTANPLNFRFNVCCALIVREFELLGGDKKAKVTPRERLYLAAGVSMLQVQICCVHVRVSVRVHVCIWFLCVQKLTAHTISTIQAQLTPLNPEFPYVQAQHGPLALAKVLWQTLHSDVDLDESLYLRIFLDFVYLSINIIFSSMDSPFVTAALFKTQWMESATDNNVRLDIRKQELQELGIVFMQRLLQ